MDNKNTEPDIKWKYVNMMFAYRDIGRTYMKKTIHISFLLLLSVLCFGQNDSLSEKRFYVPKNIEDCNKQLDKYVVDKVKIELKQTNEDYLRRVYSFYIIYEWFDNDSTRLAKYFKQFSITDSEDREFLVLLSFHRHLNNKPFDVKAESRKIIYIKDSLSVAREEEHKRNLVADSIDGIFIPTDIFSCFTELNKLLNDSVKANIKKKKNNLELSEYHMGLGRWLRNYWSLWGGSRLQQYFRNKGINHPDNISGLILMAYNKYLNGENVDIDKVIQEDKIREREFFKNSQLKTTIKFDGKNLYSKEYKRFLRCRKVEHFYISN